MPDFRSAFAPQGNQPSSGSQTPVDFRSAFAPVANSSVDFMTGYTRSLVGQGMGMGFGDEAEAGIRAGVAKAGGDKRDLTEIYNEELEGVRSGLEKFQKENPVIATGTELVGAAVPAVATRGRSVPQSMSQLAVRSGLTGAGVGAGYGFGTGEGLENRANQAGIGATIGGAAGMLAAPLATAGAWAGQQIARPLINRARSVLDQDAEAGRRVVTAIGIDRRLGEGISDQGMAMARQQTGQPVMNMDQGGEVTRRLARSAANQSPEAGTILSQRIGDRFEAQGERITNWFRTRTGASGDVSATRDDLLARARSANRPAYRAAYKAGDEGIWTPELERLSSSPDVLSAMKSAATTGKSRAINEGYGAFNPGVEVSDTGVVTFTRTNKQGVPTYPNLQYWDYVKRELDDAANAARRAGKNEEASRISGQAKLLRDELDASVPEYRSARQGAAGFFQAENALEAGENFLNINVDIGAARRAFANMSSAEQSLFREGFISSLMDKVSRVPDRADVVRRIFGSEKARQQIQMVLGPQTGREFEAFMTIETFMDNARMTLGNSTTARQLAELGLAAGTGVGAYGLTGDPTTGVIVAALTRGGRALGGRALQGVDESVARRVATMLTSSDPTIYRRGLQTVARSNRLMNNLRWGMSIIAGVSGGQQGAGMVSSPMPHAGTGPTARSPLPLQ